MNKNLGLLLVVVGVVLIGVTVLFMNPTQGTEQKLVEAKLNEEQMQYLIKEMQKYLTASDNINSDTTFELDEMIKFAYSYTVYLDTNNEYASYNELTEKGTINANKLKENINLIFGIANANIKDAGYEIIDGKVEIDLNSQGGDAAIYKFKQRNLNNATGVCITDIDCLEYTSPNDKSSLLNKTEYNAEDVIYTLQIKYREVDGRKVLLAYSTYSNYEY